jgi:branched-chain amino acid transport system ATP-binding protein
MSVALKISGVDKSFGRAEIIRGINLEIEKGERHAIIGPNGAGKSTLFNLISGKYSVTSGSIDLNGQSIHNRPPYEINRLGLARSFQVTNIFPRMSVFENVRCGLLWSTGHRYSFWQLVDRQRDVKQRTDLILEQLNMTARADVPAGLLSYADQRALEIGITIASGCDVVLLDEPTAGMSNSETEYAVKLMREITTDKTLLVVEHDMSVVFDLADRISVLVYGEIIATGTPDEIRQNAAVQEAYLGTETETE